MPIFSITNLITYRQLSHGSNYRSVKLLPASSTTKKKKKKCLHRQTQISTIKREAGTMWVNIWRLRGGKLSPKEKSQIICRETVYVVEKGSFCCISVALDLTTGLLLGDILKVNQTSSPPPSFSLLSLPPSARERREAHSSIGNLKEPGGKIRALHWLLLCRGDSSLNSRLKGTLFSDA